MTGYLTTHVLDTARGCPGQGIAVSLWQLSPEPPRQIASAVTNSDGRTDVPLLAGTAFGTGVFELVFEVGAYLRRIDGTGDAPPFLDQIPLRFVIADAAAHYHVPLLLSPFGYTTYRGS